MPRPRPTFWQRAGRAAKYLFGYDAVASSPRRRSLGVKTHAEDDILKPHRRKKLISSTRDLQRNFAIAKWMIAKHLDFVSSFRFQSRTGNKDLDFRIEELMKWWSRPGKTEITRRHPLRRLVRLVEARRIVDGDVFVLKTRSGQLQVIEGDRVRTEKGSYQDPNVDIKDFKHGVKTDRNGAATAICVCARDDSGGYKFERVVPSRLLYQHAWYERIDQIRGISPMSAALNPLQDIYESFEYALAKAKVSQLFGLATFRGAAETIGEVTEAGSDTATDSDSAVTQYETQMPKAPWFFDFDPEDKVELIESRTPSTEFDRFTSRMIGVALKALSMPYSFYDESFTNYSGSRQALLLYNQAADEERADIRELLDWITGWKFGVWVGTGILKLPGRMQARDLAWEWQGTGIPWIDPLKEVKADLAAIAGGVMSVPRVTRRMGNDAYEIVDEQAEWLKYRQEAFKDIPGAEEYLAGSKQMAMHPDAEDVDATPVTNR